MQDNPFSPPKAVVEGAPAEAAIAPPLWNPNAAANWCLLLSPIFGTWLHMKNWTALQETERAASARRWLIASGVLVLATFVLALRPHGVQIPRAVNFVLLIAWYFAAARDQARYVKERFGENYPRRGWAVPLLLGLGAIVGVILFATVLVVAGIV